MNLEEVVKDYLKKVMESYQDGKTPKDVFLSDFTQNFIEMVSVVGNEANLRVTAIDYAVRFSEFENLIQNSETILKFLKG